jgi:hypothetical protein
LDEHARHGHPDLDEVAATLHALGLRHRIEPLTTVVEWLTSFVMDLCDPADPAVARRYCSLVNSAFSEKPPRGLAYRYLVTIDLDRANGR